MLGWVWFDNFDVQYTSFSFQLQTNEHYLALKISKIMYKLTKLSIVICAFLSLSNGDVETILNNPDAINIQAVGVSSDLIWTDEKDMVGKFLPDKVKKNGKATGFRDIILENIVKVGFNRVMEKIRNPHLFMNDIGVRDPMPLSEKINMQKEEDLYK